MASSSSHSSAKAVSSSSGSSAAAFSSAKVTTPDGRVIESIDTSFGTGAASASASAKASAKTGEVSTSADVTNEQDQSQGSQSQSSTKKSPATEPDLPKDGTDAAETPENPVESAIALLLGNHESNLLTPTQFRDVFLGFDGADTFVVSATGTSLLEADVFADFDSTEGDKIKLGDGLFWEDISLNEIDFDGDSILDATAIVSAADGTVLAIALNSVDDDGLTTLTEADFVLEQPANPDDLNSAQGSAQTGSSSSSSATAFVDDGGAGATSEATATDSLGNTESSTASEYVPGATSSSASADATTAEGSGASASATVDVPADAPPPGPDTLESTTSSSEAVGDPPASEEFASTSSEVDILIGSQKNDVLAGTDGQEIFLGFAGEDVFTLAETGVVDWKDADIIADFVVGEDQFLLGAGLTIEDIVIEKIELTPMLSLGAIRLVEGGEFLAIALNAIDSTGAIKFSLNDFSAPPTDSSFQN